MRFRRIMGLSFLSIVMTAGAALGDWNNDSDNYGATTWLSLSKGPPRWKGDDGKSVKPTAKDLVEYDYTVVPPCERMIRGSSGRRTSAACARSWDAIPLRARCFGCSGRRFWEVRRRGIGVAWGRSVASRRGRRRDPR